MNTPIRRFYFSILYILFIFSKEPGLLSETSFAEEP